MKVVFRNDKEPEKADLRRYVCVECKEDFRWESECYSKLIIDGYNDIYECLCPKCSKEYEKKIKRNGSDADNTGK